VSPLLAQANNNNGPPDEFLIGLVVFVCGFYLVLFIIAIFFLLTLHKALARCAPRNRAMEPALVWLNLIPLVHFVWMFFTAIRVSESLRNEFSERGWGRRSDDYGQGLGIATCALSLASYIPYLGCLCAVGWVVCFIMYWVKIAGYSGQLASRPYGEYEDDRDGRYEEDDEDEDDRPRRRARDGDDRDDDDRPWNRGR
jgi:hypothetical protein